MSSGRRTTCPRSATSLTNRQKPTAEVTGRKPARVPWRRCPAPPNPQRGGFCAFQIRKTGTGGRRGRRARVVGGVARRGGAGGGSPGRGPVGGGRDRGRGRQGSMAAAGASRRGPVHRRAGRPV